MQTELTKWPYAPDLRGRALHFAKGYDRLRHEADEMIAQAPMMDGQPRSAKHRYVFFTGNKRERKCLRSALRYGVYPYPKGDSRHYNTKEPKGVTNEL